MGRKIRMRIVNLGLIVLLLCLLSGCTPPGTYFNSNAVYSSVTIHGREYYPHLIPIDADLLQDKVHAGVFRQPPEYHIGPYDVLNVIVWGHPELSYAGSGVGSQNISFSVGSNQQVTSNGSNSVTPSSATNGFLVNANGYIFYPFIGRIKISGLTVEQAGRLLTRRLSDYIRHPQVSVQVSAYRSREIFMVGEINRPGVLPLLDKPTSLFDAISRAGGSVSSTSDTSHIYVIRGSLKGLYIYWLNARSPMALILSEHFYLIPNDIVYVSPAPVVSWNRVMSQIMPTIQNIWYMWDITNRS